MFSNKAKLQRCHENIFSPLQHFLAWVWWRPFILHPSGPPWVLSPELNMKFPRCLQSVQNGEKFGKCWKVCKMVQGDRSWKTHHGLLQPKSAAKPSHLEKWLVKLSDSIMFNDLIAAFISPYLSGPWHWVEKKCFFESKANTFVENCSALPSPSLRATSSRRGGCKVKLRIVKFCNNFLLFSFLEYSSCAHFLQLPRWNLWAISAEEVAVSPCLRLADSPLQIWGKTFLVLGWFKTIDLSSCENSQSDLGVIYAC